jgi:hypothetical protein
MIRPLEPRDIPALKAMAEASGYPYPNVDDPLVEAVLVVTDDEDRPVMAVAAKRLVELYLWCGKGMAPSESVAALRVLHEAMGEVLKAKGYHGVEAFLPPNVSGKFGRRLEKTFGWVRNWQSWTRRI